MNQTFIYHRQDFYKVIAVVLSICIILSLSSCAKETFTYKVRYQTAELKAELTASYGAAYAKTKWITHFNVYPAPITESIYQCMVEAEITWIESELHVTVDTLEFVEYNGGFLGYQKMPCR